MWSTVILYTTVVRSYQTGGVGPRTPVHGTNQGHDAVDQQRDEFLQAYV